jgi:lysophospholipase L1-like esterase
MKRIIIKPVFFVFLLVLLALSCKTSMPEPLLQVNIAELENFKCDGSPEEWSRVEPCRLWANPLGGFPDTSDLKAYLKTSWTKNKLILLLDVSDECLVADTLNPWKGDAIEVFMSPFRGSEYIFQASIVPGVQKDFIRIIKYEEDASGSFSIGKINSSSLINGNKRFTEIEIELPENEVTHRSFRDFAMQIYVDDADTGTDAKNQLVWYPVGQSFNSSTSMYPVELTSNNQSSFKGASRLTITDDERLTLYVFGASPGDKIGIYRNGKFLKNYKSVEKPDFMPDSFDILSKGWDLENDSLYVSLSKKSLSFHELFLAPRLYEKIKAKRFDKDIRNFIARDRQNFPPENATLFIGSSSIVRWETLKKDFPELQIIKRGFGGSTSEEALMYVNQIAIPYKPAKIVYYEGDNDIPMGFTSEEIRDNIKAFVDEVRITLPQTKIFLISPKPSINRMHLWDKYQKTHILIRELADQYDNVEYVDVSSPMFKKDGQLNYSLFVEDGIHMNEVGYAIWIKIIRAALELDK